MPALNLFQDPDLEIMTCQECRGHLASATLLLAHFRDLRASHWVLPLLCYDSCGNLLAALDDAVVSPALEKRREMALSKAQALPTRHVRDYVALDG
jgi:hypothetical protein